MSRDEVKMTAVRQDAPATTYTYTHLLRAARRMFQPEELDRLVPRTRKGPSLAQVNGQGTAALDPLAVTEAIARDFLAKGGKYSRPFITLASYDALTGAHCTQPDGAAQAPHRLNDIVLHAAISIESFHKASLVHDDIQDGDEFRYGQPTLHVEHGVPTAINIGDFLIGLGYRLVTQDINDMGAATAADILNKMAESHTKLSEGQGAELVWRDSRNKRLSPDDAINIYALKTAPAFDAAIYCGLRLAGPADQYAQPVEQFARHLGIAFQTLNDLPDWNGDDFNKLTLGGDVLGGRPTLLWALALEGLGDDDRADLEQLVADGQTTVAVFAEIRQLFQKADAFEKAIGYVHKHRAQAEQIAETLSPEPLRRLAHHLIEIILQQPALPAAHENGHASRRPLAVPTR
jgi:geranylgeranyl diphosphate synthase, type II